VTAVIKITFGCALALIVLGVVFYVITASPTSLIPSAVGVVFGILAAIGMVENLHKHAMHVAMLLALLGVLGGLGMGLPKLPTVLSERWAQVESDSKSDGHDYVVVAADVELNEQGQPMNALSETDILNDRPYAAISQAIMGVICLVLLGFGIKSFIDARRARQTEGDGNESQPTSEPPAA